MAQDRIHIVPNDEGWGVKREGKAEAESVHTTQKEAIEAGRALAQRTECDLVVHRADGTFRKVYSISGEGEGEAMADRTNGRDNNPQDTNRVETDDVVSVGSRISWGAVLAGTAVALAVIVTLSVLSVAIGISTFDRGAGNEPYYWAAICGIITLLAAMFVGGFVTSRITAGEDKTEAMTYGVVLWGTVFVALAVLSATGANLGLRTLALFDRPQVSLPGDIFEGTQVSPADRATLTERTTWRADPQLASWLTFAGILLSMAAAVGGALAGAGPTLFLRQIRGRRAAVVTSPGGLQQARS